MSGGLARLLAVLFLAMSLALLGPTAASAARASCADLEQALRDDPAVAFTGVVQRLASDDDRLIARFRVDRVLRGEVHRIQDVLVAGPDWSEGERLLVLGEVDGEGRITTDRCLSWTRGSAGYDAALAELGEGAAPVAGTDRIEPEGWSRRDLLWVNLVVGLIGFAVLGAVAVRRLRRR